MAAMAEWTCQAVGVAGHQVMTFSAGEGPRTLLLVHGGGRAAPRATCATAMKPCCSQ